MDAKPYDLVLFGATSFVGQITFRYLYETYGLGGDLKWAIAGRSETKLNEIKQQLGREAAQVPTLIANSNDESSLLALCQQTGLILTTVGPYALYGEALIKVCAEQGVDYCDLSGEVQWIAPMIEKYEAVAQASGARIVNCCGFDSVPSDLGVYFLQQQAQKQFKQPCTQIKLRIKSMRGGLSGGTIASMLNAAKTFTKQPEMRKVLGNPYALCQNRVTPDVRQVSVNSATYDEHYKVWLAPFIMAAINTRIVFRSNALLEGYYGEQFQYDEAMMTGKGAAGWFLAQGITAAIASFFMAGAITPTRWFMEKFFLPAPGEGPTEESQTNGFYDFRFLGTTADGKKLEVKVTGDRDPGYGSTAKIIAEASLCLINDIPKSAKPGGFWTPATAMGDALVKRLQANAGLTFDVL